MNPWLLVAVIWGGGPLVVLLVIARIKERDSERAMRAHRDRGAR